MSALGSLHPGTCAVAVASSDATLIMDLNIVHLRTARHRASFRYSGDACTRI